MKKYAIDKETLKKDAEAIRKEKQSFISDFKKFIMKGNVLDLAVAVVVANAFNAIVNGLVKYIITPLVTYLTSGVSIDEWKWVIKPESLDDAGEVITSEISVGYGLWLQSILDFFVIAFSIFVVLRILKKVERKVKAKEIAEEEAEAARKQAEADAEAAKIKAENDAKEAALQQYYANVQKMTDMMAQMQKGK